MMRSSVLLLGLLVAGCGYQATVDVRKPQGELLTCMEQASNGSTYRAGRRFTDNSYPGLLSGDALTGMQVTHWRIDTVALGPNLTRADVTADREYQGVNGPREAFNAALGFVYACD